MYIMNPDPNNCRFKRFVLIKFSTNFSAKATFEAISKTYCYLTPDMWKDTVFTKTPYQEFTDFLAKNHTGQSQRSAAAKEQAFKQ